MKHQAVFVRSCPGYEPQGLLECARECLRHADPDGNLVGPDKKILLKVNMLSSKPPEKAVTTHPNFAAAVAKACSERGAKVLIGDSPAGADKGIKKYWEKTGLSAIPEDTDAELVNFEAASSSWSTYIA